MKNYTASVLIILFLLVAVLAWIAETRFQDFKSYHTAIAYASATGVANEISRFVTEKKRLVKLFAREHPQLIRQLVENPKDEDLHQRLEQHVADYFPDYFTFSLTDARGQPYIEDFDGLIGKMCKNDIEAFALSNIQRTRIHPHSEGYHFDIMASYGFADTAGILFISFHTDVLGHTLKSLQSPGHQLMLVHPEASMLIEVTSGGARINWKRDDYHLADSETRRILDGQEVPGTVWKTIDLHTPELFTDYRLNLIRQSMIIILLFLIVTIAMYVYVRRQEELRRAAEQHKDEFLSLVSHELRTPLTSIRGSMALLANNVTGKLNPQAKSLIDIALMNSVRLDSLVNDILDVQKIEAGKMEYDMQPVELMPLIERCIINNQSYAEQYGSRLELKRHHSGVVVKIDQGRIAQVMANLLSNAAKYGAKEDLIVVATAVLGDRIRISVTDHGEGIAESYHHQIFQKFVQVDSSDTRKVGGTGLGLSIVKLIVEEHGGTAGFDSVVGKGSTFYIELPIYQGQLAGEPGPGPDRSY